MLKIPNHHDKKVIINLSLRARIKVFHLKTLINYSEENITTIKKDNTKHHFLAFLCSPTHPKEYYIKTACDIIYFFLIPKFLTCNKSYFIHRFFCYLIKLHTFAFLSSLITTEKV